MRKVGLLLVALIVAAGISLAAVSAKKFETDGNPYATKIYPQAKNQEDSVLADVNAYSCYISTVRAIDYDPVANAAVLIFRATDGAGYALVSLDEGQNWTRQGPLVSGTIRYPSAMCDLANQLPFMFSNRGWASALEGADCTWDDMGYGGGLWASEIFIDTLGRGVGNAGIYVVNGVKGSSGRIHVLANYWGTHTPDASFYYYSDDNGYSWVAQDPRAGNLMHYDLTGTEDSLNIFKGTVVYDPIVGGYVNQVQIFATLSGETLMVGSCGLEPQGSDSVMGFWYRMSYDGGANWTPLTYVHPGQIGWPAISYDLGIAVDKEGYPHFATWLFMDTTAAGGYGPNTGLVDYHQTSSGWVATMIHPTDEAGTVFPSFANFGLDPNGDLIVTYRDNQEGDATMNIWAAYSNDNGATYHTYQVTTDNGGYDYPHGPMHVGGAGSKFPVFYQRGNAGFVSWVPYDSLTGVSGGPAQPTKQSFVLMQNRPNPVAKNTQISFSLPRAQDYSLRIYNVAGQTVQEFRGQGQAGVNSISWNASRVPSGIYFYKLTSGGQSSTRRLVVVK